MQGVRGADLLAKIRRSVDQGPAAVAGRNRDGGLGARPYPLVAGPGKRANRAAAIPLRKSATRGRAEHNGGEAPHQPLRRGTGPVPGSLTSELGGQIAVDFESDANFDEGRGGPSHSISLSTALFTGGSPPA